MLNSGNGGRVLVVLLLIGFGGLLYLYFGKRLVLVALERVAVYDLRDYDLPLLKQRVVVRLSEGDRRSIIRCIESKANLTYELEMRGELRGYVQVGGFKIESFSILSFVNAPVVFGCPVVENH